MPNPEVVSLKPQPFAYITRECLMENIAATIAEAFAALNGALAQAKSAPAGPPMARYSHYGDGRVTIDLGFPVQEAMMGALRAAGLKTGMTGGGDAMRAVHVGSFETLRRTYDALLNAIRAAGRAPADEMWERYLTQPGDGDEPHTEVLWPMKPALASYE